MDGARPTLRTARPRKTSRICSRQTKDEVRHVLPPASVPPSDHRDRDAARTVAFHPEQGWSLLCNGVIVFDDMGEILPGGQAIPPRPVHVQLAAAA